MINHDKPKAFGDDICHPSMVSRIGFRLSNWVDRALCHGFMVYAFVDKPRIGDLPLSGMMLQVASCSLSYLEGRPA